MKLVMLLFNVTPLGLLTPNMLAKIYDHDYKTRVPSTQELVAEAPWLDFELHCLGAHVYIPGY